MSICPQLEQPFCNFRQQISSMNEGDWNTQLDPDRAFTSPLKEWPLQVLVGINDNFINKYIIIPSQKWSDEEPSGRTSHPISTIQ